MTRPPLGLRPAWIVAHFRVVEILDAMRRYSEVGKQIPDKWIVELGIQSKLSISDFYKRKQRTSLS